MLQRGEKSQNDNTLTINQEAQTIIDLSEERKKHCKQKAVKHMLELLNQICAKYELQYFAMGKILTWCVYGEDSYPDDGKYIIGMLRKDYGIFFEKIKEPAKKMGIQVFPIYDERGVMKRVNSFLRKKEVIDDDLGKLEVTVEFRIDPYDYLPDNKKERQKYCKEATDKARDYRLASADYLEQEKTVKAGLLGRFIKSCDDIRKKNFFKKKNVSYLKFLTKYQEVKESTWVGRIETLICPSHQIKEITPIEVKDFLGTYIMVPGEIDNFIVDLKEEEEEKIARQRTETLRAFDKMCDKHEITYFAVQQLAMDAVHYQRYKPGTETVCQALGMLRDDYEKAINIIESGKECEGLIQQVSVAEYPMIHEKRVSIILEKYKKKIPGDKDYPIEIYPFDAVPSDYDEMLDFVEELRKGYRDFNEQIRVEKGLSHPLRKSNLDTWKLFEQMEKKKQRYNCLDKTPKRIFALTNSGFCFCVYNEIFPVVKRPFYDFSLSCPNNPFLWHYKKDEEYTQYLAKERTKILKIIEKICQEQELVCFPISKLLIGTVVYHDAMPMSDGGEFTLSLLRRDYDKLIEFLRKNGWRYGIQINEFCDPDKMKYPFRYRRVSFEGQEFSKAVIILAPFDKVPEDFYLRRGFEDDLDEMNHNYQDLIKWYSLDRNSLYEKYQGEELEKKIKYFKEANVRKEAEKIEIFAQIFNEDETIHTYGRNAFAKSKRITEEDLFPLQKIPFRDIMLNCPKDYTPWQPMLNEELKRQDLAIQKADLILLKEFDRVCGEMGLGYFICGGTMLGYMRHKGFIPWDNDIDVAMLREDYDKFIQGAGPYLMEGVFLQTRQTDPNIPYLFSKIRLDNTEYITNYNERRDFHKGICLDIFPFDYVPNDLKEREEFVKNVRDLAKEHNFIAERQYPIPEEVLTPKNDLEKRYYKEQEELRQYYWSQDLSQTQDAYLKEATKYNKLAKKKKLTTVASFVPTYTYIELSDLLPYQRGIFEGIEVSVPKRPDIFLEMQYGDYMELPPKHQQVSHRLLRWSTWEESWDDFLEKSNGGENL